MEQNNRDFVLGLDLDGVCGDYTEALRIVLAKQRGIDPKDLKLDVTWSFPEWGLTQEEYEKLHKIAVTDESIFLNMPVMEGASEALWDLSDSGMWIRIVTHRLFLSLTHQRAAQDTAAWLDNNNIPYRELCFVGQKTDVDADAYIEDNPDNIEAIRATGTDVVVFTQPYNKHLPGPRANNWTEAKEILEELQLKKKGSLADRLPGIGGNRELSNN